MSKLNPVIRRVDANQAAIVDALRKAGCSVLSLSQMGKGCPDLLVASRGINWLMEVKQPREPLTPDELAFYNSWHGRVDIIRSWDDAEKIIRGAE